MLLFAIAIITVLVVLYQVGLWMTKRLYRRLDGNADDRNARTYVSFARYSPYTMLDAIDLYRIGSVYDHNFGDAERAGIYYTRALRRLRDDTRGRRFIVDRIRTRVDMKRPAEWDEKLRPIVNAELPLALRIVHAKSNPPQRQHHVKRQDAIATQVEWTLDSQNVHDTVLSDEVARQCTQLSAERSAAVAADPSADIGEKTVMDICKTLYTYDYGKSENDIKTKARAMCMLAYINEHDSPLVKLGSRRESATVMDVWWKASTAPAGRDVSLKNAFITSLADMNVNDRPVCAGGRVSRLIAALAHDTEYGILKTTEALRNEILQKSHASLDQRLTAGGDELRRKYNANEQCAEVTELLESVRRDVKEHVDASELGAAEKTKLYDEIVSAL